MEGNEGFSKDNNKRKGNKRLLLIIIEGKMEDFS